MRIQVHCKEKNILAVHDLAPGLPLRQIFYAIHLNTGCVKTELDWSKTPAELGL